MSPQSPNRVELPDSVHAPVPNATHVGKAAGTRAVRVSVILNRKTKLDIAALKGRQLTRDEYAANYGASQKDFDAVRAFAQANGLKVDAQKSSLVRRRVDCGEPSVQSTKPLASSSMTMSRAAQRRGALAFTPLRRATACASPKWCGTIWPRAAEPAAAASAPCSRCPAGRRRPAFPRRRAQVVAAYRTLPGMPPRRPAIKFSSMVLRKSSVELVRWRRCGRVSLPFSTNS
jgi:hypothetical protein